MNKTDIELALDLARKVVDAAVPVYRDGKMSYWKFPSETDVVQLRETLLAVLDACVVPVIALPGSGGWERSSEWGTHLERAFPGQDAHDFAMACEYNDYGPTQSHNITRLVMITQGERDAGSWTWHLEFENGDIWTASGGCDYTGWDCQSSLNWTPIKVG